MEKKHNKNKGLVDIAVEEAHEATKNIQLPKKNKSNGRKY